MTAPPGPEPACKAPGTWWREFLAVVSIDEQPGRDRQVEILLGDDSPGVLNAILDTQRLIVFLIAGQCHHALRDVDADHTLRAVLSEDARECPSPHAISTTFFPFRSPIRFMNEYVSILQPGLTLGLLVLFRDTALVVVGRHARILKVDSVGVKPQGSYSTPLPNATFWISLPSIWARQDDGVAVGVAKPDFPVVRPAVAVRRVAVTGEDDLGVERLGAETAESKSSISNHRRTPLP